MVTSLRCSETQRSHCPSAALRSTIVGTKQRNTGIKVADSRCSSSERRFTPSGNGIKLHAGSTPSEPSSLLRVELRRR